jgi:hypothetical protein
MTFIFEEYISDTETVVSNFRTKAEEITSDVEDAVAAFTDVVTYLNATQEMHTLYQTLKTTPLTYFHEAQGDFIDWCDALTGSWQTLINKRSTATGGSASSVYDVAWEVIREHLLGTYVTKDIRESLSNAQSLCGVSGDVKATVEALVTGTQSIEDMCSAVLSLGTSYNEAVSAVSALSFTEITRGRASFACMEYLLDAATELEEVTTEGISGLVTGTFSTYLNSAEQVQSLYSTVTDYFGSDLLEMGGLFTDSIGDAVYSLASILDLSSVDLFTESLDLIGDTCVADIIESTVESVTSAGSQVVASVGNIKTMLNTLTSIFSEGRSDGGFLMDDVVNSTAGLLESVQDISVKGCAASNIAINQATDLMVAQNRVTEIVAENRGSVYTAAVEENSKWQEAFTSLSSELQQGAERGSSFV